MPAFGAGRTPVYGKRLFHALADTPDFEYVLIDSTISKVHADAAGAKGGLKLPASVARAVD
ncbi:hypothetical protein DO77_591 [Brucella suis]|nr:hypothetical protein DO77_591 [Brucella suis]